MKKFLFVVVAAMLAGQAWAATTFTIGNLKYTVTDETNHYVSVSLGGQGTSHLTGTLTIPSTVTNGSTTYTVTNIGAGAFNHCSELTSVTIPNSVTSIGGYAFIACSKLTEINVESTNKAYTSQDGILFNKDKTTIICYPAGKTETTYIIPNSVTSIGDDAFYYCIRLTSVTIPNSVTSIGWSAFAAVRFTSLTIPNSVTSIGPQAFMSCLSLTSITIPNSVMSIGHRAFLECSKLTSVTIPELVTSIDELTFYNCNSLKEITIPNSITSIGSHAFYSCDGLTTVTIPSSVTNIEGNPFSGCSKLTEINVESSNTNYTSENGVLFNKDKTTIVCYPKGKTEITYTIPESVECIGDCAFSDCSNLKTTVPYSVTSIGKRAFYNCNELTIPYPDWITSIGDNAFAGVKKLNYGDYTGATVDGNFIYADAEKTHLLRYTGTGTSVTVPSTVTLIGGNAFGYRSNLESITIPNSVKTIERDAFYRCSGLTSITIPESVESVNAEAFKMCTKLSAINVASGNSYYTSENGVLFNKKKNTLICYPAGKTGTSYTVPSGVLSIGKYAFYYCEKLSSITIPDGVKSFVDYAFANCRGLKSINIPNSVTSVGRSVFYYCSSLTSITIPESVTSFGDAMFSYCSSLKSVTLPNTITSIGSNSFSGCSSLASVTIPNSVTSIGNSAFSGCSSLASVSIPESVTDIGSRVFDGCSGLKSVTLPNTITSIGYAAFIGCSSLTSVTIPESVTSIGGSAFYNCSSLTSVTIPESVASIDNYTFYNCSNLVSVVIPNGITSIGNSMFYNCSSLTTVTIPESVASIGTTAFYNCSNLTSIAYDGISQPSAGTSAFRNVNASISVCVPENYVASSWCGISNLVKGHDKVPTPAVAATCTETGLSQGTHCSKCGRVFVAQKVVAALGHSYGTPTYTWSSTGKSCTAKAVCSRNSSHVLKQSGKITSKVTTAATCETQGTTTYTAKFTNSTFKTQTKDVVDIAALGHEYGPPTYKWSTDGKSCSAKTICSRNTSHVVTETATITSEETIAPTCEEMGTNTYTAKFTDSKFSTQTKDVVDIDALGHDYGTPTYEWTADGSACTATTICQRNETHVVTEDATITDEETVAPTCEEMGTTTYTAKFTDSKFHTQTKDVVDVPANGHTEVVDAAMAQTCTATGLTEGRHCLVCNAVLVEQEVIPANGHTADSIEIENFMAATCTMVGLYDSVVYCSVCQEELFREEKEVPANGHKADGVVFENEVAATCTEAGSRDSVVYCSVCHDLLSRTTLAIKANGHTVVVDAAIPATTTSVGKTEGSHCSVCNTVFVEQKDIPMLADNGGSENQGGNENQGENNNGGNGNQGGENNNQGGENQDGENNNQSGNGSNPATAFAESVANAVNIYAHHNIIVVENAEGEIIVYNAMGGIVYKCIARQASTTINISISGVYIVKAGANTQKVIIR